MSRRAAKIVITGPPGSGKTSLITELKTQGHTCIPEYARRVIAQQRSSGGQGTSEQDPKLFVELMLACAIEDFKAADSMAVDDMSGAVIFDRGLPDLLAFAQYYALDDSAIAAAVKRYRYDACYFAPAWEDIYAQDEERRMTFPQAKGFGDMILEGYTAHAYKPVMLPLAAIKTRIDVMDLQP